MLMGELICLSIPSMFPHERSYKGECLSLFLVLRDMNIARLTPFQRYGLLVLVSSSWYNAYL